MTDHHPHPSSLILQGLDILRIVLVAVGFFAGYSIGYSHGYDPLAQLHVMIPFVVVTIAGLAGMEGLLFGRQAAEIKGYEKGSNYQKQSALGMLSQAATALLVFFCNWGIKAELTVLFAFFFFFIASGINHAVDAVRRKNFRWQNINRPFLILLLLAGFLHPVIMALKTL